MPKPLKYKTIEFEKEPLEDGCDITLNEYITDDTFLMKEAAQMRLICRIEKISSFIASAKKHAKSHVYACKVQWVDKAISDLMTESYTYFYELVPTREREPNEYAQANLLQKLKEIDSKAKVLSVQKV